MSFERQVTLPGIGEEGQQRIENATVLIVGVGGLGSPAALYLARAGVRKLILCDFDNVQATDLHRQLLFQEHDIGEAKVKVARTRLEGQQARLSIDVYNQAFEPEMVDGADVVLDCTDESSTRALIHHACMERKTPLIWGAVEGWEAQWGLVMPGRGPCLRCLWPSPSDGPSCADAGILGPAVGIVGVWQALAALRVITKVSAPTGKLHMHDWRTDEHEVIRYEKRKDCPTCAVVPK